MPIPSPVPELHVARSISCCQRKRYPKGATERLDLTAEGRSVSSRWTSQSAPCYQTRSGSRIVAVQPAFRRRTFTSENACFAHFLMAHVNHAVSTAMQDAATAFNPR